MSNQAPSLQGWVIRECKQRQQETSYVDIPIVEITVKYITPKGKIAYKSVPFTNSGLKAGVMKQIVNSIEEDTSMPIRRL